LKRPEVMISMDGKGRCMDNIFVERLWRSLKYEEVYLHTYATVAEARTDIGAWLDFYHTERQHQSLGYRTPRQNLPGRPVDMWTIGVADRLCSPRFPSQLGKQGNARLRPHPHRHHDQQWM
jgi:Integrase core domain